MKASGHAPVQPDSAPTTDNENVARSCSAPGLAVVVALDLEARCLTLRTGKAPFAVYCSGPGRERAAQAAKRALEAGATALLSFGLAGGLRRGVAPGTVVVPDCVLGHERRQFRIDADWCLRLRATLEPRFVLENGPLLASGELVGRRADKRRVVDTGVVAVDMESAGVAEAAAMAGVPFVVLRVIADGADDELPAGIEQWIDAAGRRRTAPVFKAAFSPWQWPDLVRLGRRSAVATRTLRALVQCVGSQGFLYDG